VSQRRRKVLDQRATALGRLPRARAGGADAVTEMARKHLGAKTNAKEGRVFPERDPDPVYFAAQSLALIGPPNMITPTQPVSVSGSGSP
jgi:hypothetical protein